MERLSDDELAYLTELNTDVEYAVRKRQDYINHLAKRHGITGSAQLLPDGTIVRAPIEGAPNGHTREEVPALSEVGDD